jgi:hypothetical protein
MAKKKLNTDLDDSLKQKSKAGISDDSVVDLDDFQAPDDDIAIDPASVMDDEEADGFSPVEGTAESDDTTYTMGQIQVEGEEDTSEHETVTVLPDADKEEDEGWDPEYNSEDSDDFLDNEDFEYDDVGIDE